MRNILLVFLFIYSFQSFSQSIKGTIKNEKGEPIIGASIIAYQLSTNTMLSYSISNENGYFDLSIKELQDSVKVTVRSLGFELSEKVIKLSDDGKEINFQLTPSDMILKELEVQSKPITEQGDTLNYNVESFAKEGDESISDVLQRMPGIEINDEGIISYQGRTINKFYVEGKDLMGSQYSITSKNLPQNAVASVEVLKDHQPIKMLADVVHSVDPAINIVLKEGVTVTGNAELGGGAPYIWFAKASPMVFNKKHQTVNVLSSSNSGQDELSTFSSINLFDFLEFGLIESKPTFLLGNTPQESSLFKKSEYNDHQTHSTSTNYLTGLGKGDLKINIDAYHDTRFQDLSSNTYYFIPNDTLAIHNLQKSTFTNKYLKTRLTYEHNSDENYFKNSFHFKVLDSKENSQFYQNEELIPQTSSKNFYNVGNKLTKVIKLGNSYYKMNVYAEYTNSPEQLNFKGGPLINLPSQNTLTSIQQETHQDHFKSYVGTHVIKQWKNLTFNTKLSLNYDWRQLTSTLPNTTEEDAILYKNDLNYMSFIPKISPSIDYRFKKLHFSLIPNLSMQLRSLQNHILSEKSEVNSIVFEPVSYISYDFLGVKLNGGYNFNNYFTELPQIYSGIIISNFNKANQQHIPILETKEHFFNGGFGYELIALSLNIYGNYEYKLTNKDWISSYVINEDGVAFMETQSFNENTGVHQKVKGNFDWFLLGLKTTLEGDFEVGQNEENVILNDVANRNTNKHLSWEVSIDFPIAKGLTFSSYYNEYISNNIYQDYNQVDWSQKIIGAELQFSKKRHLIKWINKWIDHTFLENQFLYVDFSYQYKFNKKTSVIVIGQNLLDHQYYNQTTMNVYQSNQTYFYLRPRQVMAKVRFGF
ncbi:carboxypeptidase regulatory-like domain-containing protein [Flammeovirga pacifica]|uniref:TonB-dependent receptor n=1 Tax=Flammeovirga pacifica TaxID=915059 RepID=A0A1S1Z321_FLAPC|nr:carboxypeptidase-like regulatory domain-containing protein [Flammeovirga pacifica]OHX67670.1 hypothetical protein NH26_15580 [Flammeovirga pacifica]